MQRYSNGQMWVSIEKEGMARVGMERGICREMGEAVALTLPVLAERCLVGDCIAVVESNKAAIDIYTPVSGTISGINVDLLENPALLTRDPTGAGWLFCIELDDLSQLSLFNLVGSDDSSR